MGPNNAMGGPPPMMGGMPPGPPPSGHRHGKFDKGFPPKPPRETVDDFYEEKFDMAQMEKECEEMLNVHHLNKNNSSFTETDGGFISLRYNDKTYENVTIIRTFPFTKPDCLLSVRESFGKKKEIGIIENLTADYEQKTVDIISKNLELRYYMPVIEKIQSIKEINGYVNFKVSTNHGNMEFSLQSNGNHFSYLTDTRILITDLEGNRYEIPDTQKLSPKELKKLDLYL